MSSHAIPASACTTLSRATSELDRHPCDGRCGVDPAALEESGTVAVIISAIATEVIFRRKFAARVGLPTNKPAEFVVPRRTLERRGAYTGSVSLDADLLCHGTLRQLTASRPLKYVLAWGWSGLRNRHRRRFPNARRSTKRG